MLSIPGKTGIRIVVREILYFGAIYFICHEKKYLILKVFVYLAYILIFSLINRGLIIFFTFFSDFLQRLSYSVLHICTLPLTLVGTIQYQSLHLLPGEIQWLGLIFEHDPETTVE